MKYCQVVVTLKRLSNSTHGASFFPSYPPYTCDLVPPLSLAVGYIITL